MSSFNDLLEDVQKVKDQVTVMTGTTASMHIDENTIFQYLEEAGEDPNRVQSVCYRLNEKMVKSKKRKRDHSMTPDSDNRPSGSKELKEIDVNPGGSKEVKELIEIDASSGVSKKFKAIDHLREIFPHLPVSHLMEKAGNSSMADIQKVVESILNGDDTPDGNDGSVVIVDESSSSENNYINVDEISFEEMADSSMTGEVSPDSPLVDQNYQTLLTIFPDVDPDFLEKQSWDIGEDPVKLEAFISSSLENKSELPSKKESEKKKAHQDEKLKIKRLKVVDFLEMWEDPHAHFANISTAVSELYKKHALFQLRIKFPSVHHTLIVKALEETNYHFFPALQKITKMSNKKGKKKQEPLPDLPSVIDFTFLKEFVYSKLETQIRHHQASIEVQHTKAVEAARKTGGLFDCECCFDGDCLLTEIAMCEEGHMFCKDCIRRGSGVQIGDQKTQIGCLAECSSTFSLTVLKKYLSPNVFSRLLQKQQLEEVQSAGLEDLVQCPSCNFATIMPDPLDKVVRCRNPECRKESCRLCGEENHVPMTCDEAEKAEKDSDVADRVKVEKAMTEAMLRTCGGCKKQFIKEEGCNSMTCTCGAMMCYVCKKPLSVSHDPRHFGGEGKCPIYSDIINLHKDEVFKAATKAKEELNKEVKFDPTKDIEKPPEGFDPSKLPNIRQ